MTMRRQRHAKIVATLGPASASVEMIRALFLAGVDVFRLNFSHGTHEQHRERLAQIRQVEQEVGRPIGVLADMQGPKLRVGTFAAGPVMLRSGFAVSPRPHRRAGRRDARASAASGDIRGAAARTPICLLDDGKMRLRVKQCGADFAETEVIVGGTLSERKGVNVPDVVLATVGADRRRIGATSSSRSISASSGSRCPSCSAPKTWTKRANSTRGRAGIMTKLEKPSAVEALDAIVDKSDAVMVARGDLGVELPAEKVPGIQRRVVRACRRAGKPVIVATQMLESMISSPVPTRAEASDVATAIYHGADAVMLSAESASGKYPLDAVQMMERIIGEVEADPYHRELLESLHTRAQATSADAICAAMDVIAGLLPVAAIVTYTTSGSTSLRAARERPAPADPQHDAEPRAPRVVSHWCGAYTRCRRRTFPTSRRWSSTPAARACEEGFAKPGDNILISAGMPFGTPGATNLLRIAKV